MNHLVDQYFDSLIDKKIAVLGIGVSNRPLIRMLLARGLHVLACDKTPREKLDAEVLELERAGTVLHVGEHYLDDVQADIVFRTPGMHPDIPALQALRQLQTDLQRQEGVPSVQRARGPYGSLLSFSDTPIFVNSSFTRIRSTPHAASAPPLRLCTSWKRATTKSDRTMLSYSDQNRYSRNRGSKDCWIAPSALVPSPVLLSSIPSIRVCRFRLSTAAASSV